MSQYIAVLVWIAVCAAITGYVNSYQVEEFYGEKIKRINAIWTIVIAVPIIYWTATRSLYLFDTGAYARTFHEMPSSAGEIVSYMSEVGKDKGFYLLGALIHVFIGDDAKIYFGIIASVQIFFLFKTLRKYSSDFILSVFIFVASTDYISWMHNGIRQFMAVTVILAGIDYIMERHYVRAILVVLIAACFHASALLMIPIIFIIQGRPWNYKTLAVILVAALAVAYIERFTVILDNLLSDTQYTNVVSDWQEWEDNGTNPIRVLVYSIPMILSVIGYRYVVFENNRMINVAVNMSIITTVLYIISMFTSGIFIGRLPVYTSIFATCVLLPWEIDHFFTERSAMLLKWLLVAAYLLFYYYQCHITWHIF